MFTYILKNKNAFDCFTKRRTDLVVEGMIMVELNAIIALENEYIAQALNYLKAYQLEVGLLINCWI